MLKRLVAVIINYYSESITFTQLISSLFAINPESSEEQRTFAKFKTFTILNLVSYR